MPETENAIVVSNVSKSFKLPHEQHNGLKQLIINFWKRKKGYETQHVLNDISFEIKKGEFFGIVGRNGSGKSTLLKTLAGVYAPDSGAVAINGSLIPFIELGVGFNQELTGRENVYMNGALLGFSNKQMDAMYNEIVEFAELERFMDQKLKNYSSGMQVRLAFSIAIRADADILLLDEVLAVGDEAFQRKCYSYFAELKKKKKTVILVTHSMDSVQQFCDKAALIDKGHKMEIDSPAKIAKIYRELNSEKTADKQESHNENKSVDIKSYCNKTDKVITIDLDVLPKERLEDSVVTASINRNDGNMVYRWASDDETREGTDLIPGQNMHVNLEIDNIFPDGVYDINIAIKKSDRSRDYAVFENSSTFEIVNAGSHWNPGQKVKVS